MEPAGDKVRYKLVLGKFRVHRVNHWPGGSQFAVDLLNGSKLVCDVPNHCDIEEGDLLTLYTEVLARAQPSTTSVQ